ncbi:leucyl aminopeptidase family protein [Bartonella sp. TP]|uniref:leucyl aminopeptidase family protein n=1 Tax=Bartonella sp. TP TaxID=3057550 RepID=UPI0025B26F3F|nr:leucyl aminopeptidase family protein [Bartonella sp. TP]MDN5249228.1 leucyl aminopeptidase family protein [Alphaproteobacteria bacterium]WJW80408.1 leucyl aminopeptidase family protein [Bartonella sp. TP]
MQIFIKQNAEALKQAIPIYFVDETTDIAKLLSPFEYKQIAINKSTLTVGQWRLVFNEKSELSSVLFAMGNDPFSCAILAQHLPKNIYYFANLEQEQSLCYLGFALGFYRFDKYKTQKKEALPQGQLMVVEPMEITQTEQLYEAISWARDLINEPTNHKSTQSFATIVQNFAARYQAQIKIVRGQELQSEFPLVHAVGRAASENAPILIDLSWGLDKSAPMVALVGKGVCFDSGGLDIKSASNMLLMKKDMGGAATILALAKLIIEMNLNIRLRVVLPMVENAISGNSFRPGDVLQSRAGLNIEIGNTDAEGRLILADALAYIDEERPDLLIDMATLTGAARVALGPKIPPFFTDDEALAADLANLSKQLKDPMWRLPLANLYENGLSSKVADMNNISMDGFAGSIIAALFLKKFVKNAKAWVHFDIYGWNLTQMASCPVGGEAQCVRVLYALLLQRYGKN